MDRSGNPDAVQDVITLTSSGAASARAFGFGAGTVTDPYFADVTLLLHCEGANLGTSFTDSSLLANAMTATAAGAVTNTGTVKFGDSSLRLRNAGNNLSCANTGFFFGTDDFTFECWIYYDSIFPPTALGSFFSNSATNTFLAGYGASTSNLIFYGAGGPVDTTGWAHGMSAQAWNHAAWVRNGANRTIYVNGNSIGTAADVGGVSFTPSAGTTFLGSNPVSPFATVAGNVDEIRVTTGVARYTSNFAVPTSPFPNS